MLDKLGTRIFLRSENGGTLARDRLVTNNILLVAKSQYAIGSLFVVLFNLTERV
jgi:hypothetical protein